MLGRNPPVNVGSVRTTVTLRVQVVLLLTPLAQVWRLTNGQRRAKEAGFLSRVDIALGDYSARLVMGGRDVERLRKRALDGGIDLVRGRSQPDRR